MEVPFYICNAIFGHWMCPIGMQRNIIEHTRQLLWSPFKIFGNTQMRLYFLVTRIPIGNQYLNFICLSVSIVEKLM